MGIGIKEKWIAGGAFLMEKTSPFPSMDSLERPDWGGGMLAAAALGLLGALGGALGAATGIPVWAAAAPSLALWSGRIESLREIEASREAGFAGTAVSVGIAAGGGAAGVGLAAAAGGGAALLAAIGMVALREWMSSGDREPRGKRKGPGL